LVSEKLKSVYPDPEYLQTVPFVNSPGGGAFHSDQMPGISVRFWDKLRSGLIQIGPGIASANQTKYETWEQFRPSVKLMLTSYLSTTNPETVLRCAARYINRFDFENMDEFNLDEYLDVGFWFPSSLSPIEGFQLVAISSFDNVERPGRARVNLSSLPVSDKKVSLILDIDCSSEGNLSSSPSALMGLVDRLHDKVSEIFESFLTQKMREILSVEGQR